MSILKAKVARVHNKHGKKPSFDKENKDFGNLERSRQKSPSFIGGLQSNNSLTIEEISRSKTSHFQESPHKKKANTSINIMKNYCRGIINFALSRIAIKYLMPLLLEQKSDLETFRKFIHSRKNKINCIKQLRKALLAIQEDNVEITAMKNIFKEITIIFLKFFAPNWIYNSKISDKYAHLSYRFKILRRVKNPQHFTYLHGFEQSS